MLLENDSQYRQVLENAKVIAMVGHSDKPDRISYQVAKYLRAAGYTVHPVNPTVEQIDGHTSYASLADVPGPIDIVNVFRRSEYLPQIVEQAIAVDAKAVWTQQGISHPKAAELAQAAQLDLVMDRCIYETHMHLIVEETPTPLV